MDIDVVQIADGTWIMCLLQNDVQVEWDGCRSTCLEHAEAEAVARWPFAVNVNGIAMQEKGL